MPPSLSPLCRRLSAILALALLGGCTTPPTVSQGGKTATAAALSDAGQAGSSTDAADVASLNSSALGAPPAGALAATASRRVLREWRAEKTPDGRTVYVSYETEIDADGRPLGPSSPTNY